MRAYFALFAICFTLAGPAFADTSPSPSPIPSYVVQLQTTAAQASVDAGTFLGAVWGFIQNHGGLGMPLEIACICLLLVASMKVSVLDSLIWNKLQYAQVLVAPVLGIIVGLCLVKVNGALTFAAIMTYFGSGCGAVALHELLDGIKGIPGLGTVYVNIITAVENLLGGTTAGSTPSSSTS